METVVLWVLIAVAVCIIDILSSNFCFILLAVGCIGAVICAYAGFGIIIQVITFAVLNIISIAVGYPWLKKKFKKNFVRTPLMEETYIGKVLESDKEIKDIAQIRLGGDYWMVVNKGEIINPGDKFKIIGLYGIKLLIQKAEEE